MNTLVVFATKHGCTESVVKDLAGLMEGSVETINLTRDESPDPGNFDSVVVGGSIHAGKVQSVVRKFCLMHTRTLLEKKLGLFPCHMETGEKARKQMKASYPESLRTHANSLGLLGGRFDFSRMNFLERSIVRKVSGVTGTTENLDAKALLAFAEGMNH